MPQYHHNRAGRVSATQLAGWRPLFRQSGLEVVARASPVVNRRRGPANSRPYGVASGSHRRSQSGIAKDAGMGIDLIAQDRLGCVKRAVGEDHRNKRHFGLDALQGDLINARNRVLSDAELRPRPDDADDVRRGRVKRTAAKQRAHN